MSNYYYRGEKMIRKLAFFSLLSFFSIALKANTIKLSKKHFGYVLMDLKSGEVLDKQRSKESFHPASVVKIFSFATFLKDLGPEFRPITNFYLEDFDPKTGINKGRLFIEGSYDPSLVYDGVFVLFDYLKSMGLKKQLGAIQILGKKGQGFTARGFRRDPNYRAYAAESLKFNLNSNSFAIIPGVILKKRFSFSLPREIPGAELIQRFSIGKKNHITILAKELKEKVQFKISGSKTEPFLDRRYYRRLPRPEDAHCALLLRIANKNFDLETPSCFWKEGQAKGLHIKWPGKTLFEGSRIALKISQNFMTESYGLVWLKERGLKVSDKTARLELEKRLKSELHGSFKIGNLSGLGGGHSFSPLQVSQFLKKLHSDFDIFPEFLSSLPIYGKDGTLKRRKEKLLIGQIRANTGSISGVVSLAGYLKAKSGKRYVFAIFANSWKKSMYNAFKLQDKKLKEWWLKY